MRKVYKDEKNVTDQAYNILLQYRGINWGGGGNIETLTTKFNEA